MRPVCTPNCGTPHPLVPELSGNRIIDLALKGPRFYGQSSRLYAQGASNKGLIRKIRETKELVDHCIPRIALSLLFFARP